ncbi:hypothetical protein J4441_02435 [Candidatus Micrarchaeota archaeon]|nr:hypothetical protein [Candidatus Micrarchaeota archaeon]
MLIFQVFAQKQQQQGEAPVRESGEGENIFHPAQFLQSDMKAAEKLFEKNGYSHFLQTLTPGAKNAVYAASFAWGFENASRALSGAMEQQSAQAQSDKISRSTSVVKGMCDAAAENSLAQPQAVSFVWSFYNEDLKSSQATASKSEIMVEDNVGSAQKPVQGQHAGIGELQAQPMQQIVQAQVQMQMQEVLSQCIQQGDLSRSFEVCAAQQAQQSAQQSAQKIEIEKAQQMQTQQVQAQQAKLEISEEKRVAMLAEYDKAISALEQKIEEIKNADARDLQKLEELVQKEPRLPKGILKLLSSLKKEERGKRAYIALLKKELLGLQKGRSVLSTLTGSSLSKMLSLKSLLSK